MFSAHIKVDLGGELNSKYSQKWLGSIFKVDKRRSYDVGNVSITTQLSGCCFLRMGSVCAPYCKSALILVFDVASFSSAVPPVLSIALHDLGAMDLLNHLWFTMWPKTPWKNENCIVYNENLDFYYKSSSIVTLYFQKNSFEDLFVARVYVCDIIYFLKNFRVV